MLRHMNDNDLLRIVLDATFLNPKNEKKHQKMLVHSWQVEILQGSSTSIYQSPSHFRSRQMIYMHLVWTAKPSCPSSTPCGGALSQDSDLVSQMRSKMFAVRWYMLPKDLRCKNMLFMQEENRTLFLLFFGWCSCKPCWWGGVGWGVLTFM